MSTTITGIVTNGVVVPNAPLPEGAQHEHQRPMAHLLSLARRRRSRGRYYRLSLGTPMPRQKIAPIHPGEILLEEFLRPLQLSQYRLAKDVSVPARRINEIVHGTRAVTADTALRLARYFGTSDRFWLNLQARYDLEMEKDRLGKRLEREVRVLA